MSRPIRHVPCLPVPSGHYAPGGVRLDVYERLVIGVLLDDWSRHGEATLRASMADLAADAGVSVRRVFLAIDTLEAHGLLAIERSNGGRRRWSTFRLTLPETLHTVPSIRRRNAARRAAPASPKPCTEKLHTVPTHTERDPSRSRAPLTGALEGAWVDEDEGGAAAPEESARVSSE